MRNPVLVEALEKTKRRVRYTRVPIAFAKHSEPGGLPGGACSCCLYRLRWNSPGISTRSA